MNFGALPPEINSGRMYSGPGSGPMLAAATAWDGLAAELASMASSYDSVISGLTSEAWSGPTAMSMAAAAAPYAAWMSDSATHAEQTATQARAAAAAHDTAFAAMVPPPTIAANRGLLMSLIATNILGQNTPAIAATEAEYAEMWAQDATAMYGYAGASASAATLRPFTNPPPTTSTAGLSGQAVAVTQAAAGTGMNAQTALSELTSLVPQALQGLAASAPSAQAGPITTILNALSGPLSPASLYGIGGVPYLLAVQCVLLPMNGANVVGAVTRALAAGAAAAVTADELTVGPGGMTGVQLVSSSNLNGVGSTVSAGLGKAGSIGRLSVPQGWTAATPVAKTVAAALPDVGSEAVSLLAADSENGLMSDLALGSLAGRAIGATGGAASRSSTRTKRTKAENKPTTATIIVIPASAED